MVTPTREADLRSLDRARMYTIFKPLDADEALTREQLLAAKRFRTLGRWELAGALWLPALVVIMTLVQWADLPAPLGLSAIGLTFFGLLAFALRGDSILRRLK